MNKIFLKEKHLNILKSIFDACCKNASVYAYGSRVKGEAHEGSDLDLVVVNNGSGQININKIKEAMQNSSLPFLVDIFELKSLPASFQKEIEKEKILIYGQD